MLLGVQKGALCFFSSKTRGPKSFPYPLSVLVFMPPVQKASSWHVTATDLFKALLLMEGLFSFFPLPHPHFGLSGGNQFNMLVCIVLFACILAEHIFLFGEHVF